MFVACCVKLVSLLPPRLLAGLSCSWERSHAPSAKACGVQCAGRHSGAGDTSGDNGSDGMPAAAACSESEGAQSTASAATSARPNWFAMDADWTWLRLKESTTVERGVNGKNVLLSIVHVYLCTFLQGRKWVSDILYIPMPQDEYTSRIIQM